MPNLQNTLMFSSILFLIVIELSSRFRDEDLSTLARSSKSGLLPYYPNIGVFSIVHTLNSALLMMGLQVIFLNYWKEGNVSTFLVLMTTVFLLLMLPYLEIDGYEAHLAKVDGRMLRGREFTSFRIHLIFSVLAMVFTGTLVVLAVGGNPIPSLTIFGVGLSIFVMSVVFGPAIFLYQLKKELQTFR